MKQRKLNSRNIAGKALLLRLAFERAYANQAFCGVSSYNMLLGARSTSTGLYDFGQAFREFYPETTSMPAYFKNKGYYKAAIGKVFHVGHKTYNDKQSWTVPHEHDLGVEYANKSKIGQAREEALFGNASIANPHTFHSALKVKH